MRVIEFYEKDIGSSAINDNACACVTAGGPTPSLRDKERVTSGNLDKTGAEGTSDSCRRPRNERSEPKTVHGNWEEQNLGTSLCGLLYPLDVDVSYKIMFPFRRVIFWLNR